MGQVVDWAILRNIKHHYDSKNNKLFRSYFARVAMFSFPGIGNTYHYIMSTLITPFWFRKTSICTMNTLYLDYSPKHISMNYFLENDSLKIFFNSWWFPAMDSF